MDYASLIKRMIPVLLVAISQGVLSQESCCAVQVVVEPPQLPTGEEAVTIDEDGWSTDTATLIANAFESAVFRGQVVTDCPLIVEPMSLTALGDLWLIDDVFGIVGGAPVSPEYQDFREKTSGDYKFKGMITATDAPIVGGSHYGQLTMTMDLIDTCPDRFGSTVRSGRISWGGSKIPDIWHGGVIGPEGMSAVRALGQQFTPLDDIIENYQRIPLSCAIETEQDAEEVLAGETLVLTLQKIDGRLGPSPRWQRLGVKAEKKGKIVNGSPGCAYRVFYVGGGSISVKYRAPDCPKKDERKETVTVANTCINCPSLTECFIAFEEIARKELKIVPKVSGKLVWRVDSRYRGELGYTVIDTRMRGEIPFTVDYGPDPPRIEGEGLLNISFDTVHGVCRDIGYRYGWHLELGGEQIEGPEGEPELHFEVSYHLKEHGSKGTRYCPAPYFPERHDSGVGSPVHSFFAPLVFPLEDGHVLEWENAFGGHYERTIRATLKLDCP